ncbi:MAG: copper-translocating P-type ATPase [Sulfobacillus acidophilus]|uniref:Probable copper-transporting ATPase SynA n=1 Tax=Sulfobacillus acidophilus TaxID=53633 RepID=A0A2T2WL77_9FIRM|nr:MAG: copper-translocating P-type ATPase [Sulfobacillus acidophilus]
MTCASCVSHVEKALKTVPGVTAADVNLALENARVRFAADLSSPKDFVQAVSQAGYHVRTESRSFALDGLEEAPLRERAEAAVQAVPGVVRVLPNAAQGVLMVERVRGLGSDQIVLEALAGAGFQATPMANGRDAVDPRELESQQARRRLLIAVLFTLPLWAAMVRMFLGVGPNWMTNGWLELVAASVVQWGPGFSFTRRAWLNVRHGNGNMDVLVATGTLAAWAVSVYGVLAHAPLYFDTSATVITLILVGKYLEAVAKGKTSAAIRELLALQPKTTRLVGDDGTTEEILIDAVLVGQRLEVWPGDHVPVDGLVWQGEALLDESMLTGEADPSRRQVGQLVTGGTVHRGDRPFVMEATRVGRDMVLSQIVQAVEEAQAAKAPIQQFADRVSNVFVPIVLSIALVTFVGTGWFMGDWRTALLRAVAVLVVACPCSLGLATPTAVMVGSGLGARRGVLFRNGEALERVAQVDHIAMDKTGTLTAGHPSVVEVMIWGEHTQQEVLALAAALEKSSSHPLALAVREQAGPTPLSAVADVYSEEGQGLVGRLDEETVLIGNEKLLESYEVSIPDEWRAQAAQQSSAGRTVVWLAVGSTVWAALVIADALRPDAQWAVNAMKQQNLSVSMLSGDQSATVRRIAQEVGIDEAHGELSPQDKAHWVQQLEAAGHHVAMVGDGINDAPALARAFVGMAIVSGSDVATQTAEVTLMRPDVGAVLEALTVGRKTMGKIRQNLFWALFYNVVMIPLAILGVLSPMIAGAFMAFSSVTVVTNSLLLNWTRKTV